MRIRALAVQTAQVQGQFNRNIPEGRTITALMSSTAVGYSAGTTPAARQTEQTATAQIQSVASAPAPQPRLQISESDLVGVWKGSYIAGQGETALMLSVYEERGAYIAIFDFYNLPGKSNSREGKYYMQVSYNKSREKFYLKGIEWIERPSGYGFADLEGTITRDVFSGFLSGSNNTFRVIRQETD
jgi:hypothetical protein